MRILSVYSCGEVSMNLKTRKRLAALAVLFIIRRRRRIFSMSKNVQKKKKRKWVREIFKIKKFNEYNQLYNDLRAHDREYHFRYE